ncbi:tape measure protein [Snodgrassella sp. ESL0253]|uniref:tape measure protein n=1 Tax=Snodgrassella sp. ESL0253 TaxID=2705031 RepID=UPI0015822E74|nr:tape measure protein [Snodgrassella sp. ESL0253]NUE66974.1 tape measure protein [Snodgrassella sp. ESL0253]
MSEDLTIGVGIDARGFISGIRSTEEQAKKASQALTRAYQASARSVNGLTDAVIATRAQTLLNLGVTMEQVDAFKQTAVSVRKYKEELKKVSGEYENNSAGLNKYLLDFGKQNELLSLATISMRELRAEEAALAAMRKARPAAPEPTKAATPTAAKMDAVPPVAVKIGDIDVKGLNEFNAKLDTALVKAKHLAVAMLGIGSMKQLSGMADEWTTVNNRLKLVIDSTTELMQVRSQLMASANNTGQSLSTVAELYNKLVTAQNQTGISGSKLLKLTDTINKAMVIGGGSAESQAAALVQLSQAFASGTLRGEELNSVLEQAPGLAQTIAKGLGTTVGQLRALAAAGKLTSEAIANAILKQAPVVDAQFSKMVKTISQSATTLKNKVMSFVGALDETTGTSRKAGEMMEWLGNHLGTVAKVVGTVAAVYTGKYAASIAAVIIRKYAEIAASEKSTAAMLKEAAAAKFLATAKASSAATGTTGAAGAASAVGSVAGMAKGGWIGLVAGLATAAFTYYEISKATDVATNSLRAQIGTIEELKEKYAAADTTEKTHLRNEAEKNYYEAIKQKNKLADGLVRESVDVRSSLFHKGDVTEFQLMAATPEIKKIEEALKSGELTAEQASKAVITLLNLKPDSKSAKAIEERLYKFEQFRKQSNEYAKEINAYGGNVPLFETAEEKEQAAAAGVKKVDEAFKALIDSQTQSNALLEKQKELMAGGMSAKVAAEVAKASTGQLKGKDAELKEYTQSLLANESLQKQIDNINSVSDTLQALGKSADEAKAELDGGKEGLTLFQLSTKNATSAQIEQAKQAMAQSKLYREQLQNQQTLKDMVQQAQEARAELIGGKNGLIAFRLGLTHATDEQIRQAQAVNALTEQIQKQKSVMATLEGLKEQVETLGMDSIQRQLYGMRKNGATPEQLRYAEAMLKQIKSFDEAQKDTKAAAQDLSEAAEELKNGSHAGKDKPISIFSKEYRDREDAYWKKKREEEQSMGGISAISGRRPSAPDVNLMSAPMAPAGFGSGKGAAKDIDDMIKVMEAIKVEISNGDKNVTLKALFDAPNGANEFKQMLKNTLHSVARDLR